MKIPRVISRLVPSKWKLAVSRASLRFQPLASLRSPAPGMETSASPWPHWIESPNPLSELGEKWRPTKRVHNYLPYYWLHFRDIRHSVRNVIEIGVETERSVRMWEEFFPNATIHGIDINPGCAAYSSGRVKIHVGSQADEAFLERCVSSMSGGIDIVIDDGSHRPDHQIASFNFLFPRLSSHGIYVIEDTGACVDDVALRTVNRLKTLIDRIFYWPDDPSTHWTSLAEFPESSTWLDRHVTGIAFYRWMVFVMRGNNPGDNPHLPVDESQLH